MKQAKLQGFEPPNSPRCRVCGRKLTDKDSIAAGIGPKCKAAQDAEEEAFLGRMDGWNVDGDGDSYPCVKMKDVNQLLGIIRRLKNDKKNI